MKEILYFKPKFLINQYAKPKMRKPVTISIFAFKSSFQKIYFLDMFFACTKCFI